MTSNLKIGLKPGSRNLAWVTDSEVQIIKNCIAENISVKGEVIYYEINKPENIKSIYPLNRGIITNEKESELLEKILKKLNIKPESHLVVASPETEYESGRALLEKTIIKALNPVLIEDRLVMFPESFCGAVSKIGVDNAMNTFFTTINMGSTSTGFGVFSAGERKLLTSFTETSGCNVDDVIFRKLINTYGIPLTDILNIQKMKENFSFREPGIFPVDILTKDNGKKTVDCYPEILSSMNEYAKKVADLFISILPSDSSTSYHILSNEIFLTGGMNNIPDINSQIKKYIEERIGKEINLITVRNGEVAPAVGAYLLAKEVF